MSMNGSLSARGAVIGGLVGGIARGGVTLFNLGSVETIAVLMALPSAAIGLLCGALAGATAKPVRGALLGAFLSAGVFGLFMLPFAYVFSIFNAAGKVGEFAWPYLIQKGIAGAVGGGVGAYFGGRGFASGGYDGEEFGMSDGDE